MTIPGLRIELDSEIPVYQQIADGVRGAAAAGILRPGHRLPPTRDLARLLGVNRNTVVAAYETLAAEGWVRSHTGRGTFLVSRPGVAAGDGPLPESDTWFTAFSRAFDGQALAAMGSIYGLVTEARDAIGFVGSYPADELIPVEPFRAAIDRALRHHGPALLAYGPTAGLPALRETIARGMRAPAGARVPADSIVVTNGAQQGLEIVFRTFVDRGDAVVIEEPTYTGALGVLAAIGGRPVAVPVDEEGIRPDLLEIALERHRPRLLYVQPTFHNPTGRVMGPARRRDVLALAQRHRCPIVEDDWAGDLRLDGEDQPSLHALDGGQHVIYLGTFSKKLMPGLRIGWIAAPAPVVDHLAELKRIQDCGTSPLLQAALDVFLRDGGLAPHLDRVRPVYRGRRDRMLAALSRDVPSEVRWDRPEGGLFVWVRLPSGFDGTELFAAARREGVLYSRGELFHSDGSGRNTMRLTYSAANDEQIDSGVAILGRLIAERLGRVEAEVRPRAGGAVPIL